MIASSFIFGLLDLNLKAFFPCRILRRRPVTWMTSPRFPIALNKRSHGVCCLTNFFVFFFGVVHQKIVICLCIRDCFPGKSRYVLKKACIGVRAGDGWGRCCSTWDKWGVLARGNGTSTLTSIKNIT